MKLDLIAADAPMLSLAMGTLLLLTSIAGLFTAPLESPLDGGNQ